MKTTLKEKLKAFAEAFAIVTLLTCSLILMPISFYYPVIKHFFL